MKRAVVTAVRASWLPIAIFAVWWAVSRNSQSFYFPPLSEILRRFQELWLFDRVASDVVPSLRNLTFALMIALAVGVPAGLALGIWARAHAVIGPVLTLMWATPKLALFPAFIAILGLGDKMQVSYIAMGIVWPILIGTIDGIRAADPTLRDTMASYRVRRSSMVLKVLLPGAAPQIFAGIRTALSIGLVLVIVGEMLAASRGIGYFVLQAQQNYAMADMWAGALLVGALGYLINLLFSVVERYVLGWHIARRNMHAS